MHALFNGVIRMIMSKIFSDAAWRGVGLYSILYRKTAHSLSKVV